jgi:sigma-B regulation protein RsbU (phosphoserine phosphatase)
MIENARILLIDDNALRRKKLAQRLRDLGAAAVDEAADGPAALATARAAVPEIALIEACLPDDGAVRLIQTMMADARLNGIAPLLLVPAPQADALEDTLDRAVAAGAADWMLQPVSSALLRVQLEQSLIERRKTIEQRELVKREKLLNDVATARRFQLDFLPKEMPQPDGWQLAAALQPAREVAGDFYDVFPLTQGRRIGLVIADICDKGVGAALFMALIRSMTRAFAQQNHNTDLTDLLTLDGPSSFGGRGRGLSSVGVNALKAAVSLTNNYIVDNHADLNMFATMFFGILDPRTGVLDYINGGHNPPYVVAADGVIKSTLKPTGPAVGMMPGSEFVVEHIKLEPGDTLITYTDGVPDARDPHGKRYGDARFRQLLGAPITAAQQAMDLVQDAMRNHIADADQFDDITLLFVRRDNTQE